MSQADSASRRHLVTLCHEEGCCPEIFHLAHQPADSCLEVIDDFGNHAVFGPDTLLSAELRPMTNGPQPDLYLLRDDFGGEVYMQLGQYSEMLSDHNCALIREVAAERGVGIFNLVERARARIRNLASA